VRARLLLLTAVLLAPAARAQDPKIPGNMDLPFTAMAKAAADPKGGATITMRMLTVAPADVTKKVTQYEAVTRVVNGKQVVEAVPVERQVTISVMKATGWRELRFGTADRGVMVHDTAGKPLPGDRVAAALAKEVPVLVSMTGEPVDPFHLLTAKEGTLVLVVPPHLLFPPPPEPAPVPKKP
jgi:hypothetical protein